MDAIGFELHTVAAVRAIEAQAMRLPGHDAWSLMQRAGAAAFTLLRTHWPAARDLVVACGSGNNGGDGLVVATLAHAAGLRVRVLQVGAAATRAPATQALQAWRDSGGAIEPYAGGDLPAADVIVDALFGIGLTRAPEGVGGLAIAAINRHPAAVLALDVPSGLDADLGGAPGACVEAELTASFIAWKRGLWTGVAARVCGERQLCALDLPAPARDGVRADARLLAPAWLAEVLPPRRRDAHKGDCGHVLVIGGDHGFAGAALLAGSAAARSGAGLVTVATRGAHVAAMLARRPELMVKAVDATGELAPLLERANVIALGPGLGQGDWSLQLATAACASGKPLVADADGLNLLAAGRVAPRGALVLTPHPGEAARLLGITTAEVNRDRYAAVRALAERYRACVVLKGAGSLVLGTDGEVAVCAWGNPGMASGGMGDVLTGIIAALLAQGVSLRDAACAGTLAHALAADRAARGGERGLLAEDVVDELRAVLNP